MPVINIEDLTEKDKLKMEVEQLKTEVKLERQLEDEILRAVRQRLQTGELVATVDHKIINLKTLINISLYLSFLNLIECDIGKLTMVTPKILVSKMCEEIKTYIEANSGEDPLVKGIPEDKNPFKEKGGCVIA